jgi:hypothetical protein
LREKQKLKFSLKIVVILSKKATSENKRQDWNRDNYIFYLDKFGIS